MAAPRNSGDLLVKRPVVLDRESKADSIERYLPAATPTTGAIRSPGSRAVVLEKAIEPTDLRLWPAGLTERRDYYLQSMSTVEIVCCETGDGGCHLGVPYHKCKEEGGWVSDCCGGEVEESAPSPEEYCCCDESGYTYHLEDTEQN